MSASGNKVIIPIIKGSQEYIEPWEICPHLINCLKLAVKNSRSEKLWSSADLTAEAQDSSRYQANWDTLIFPVCAEKNTN